MRSRPQRKVLVVEDERIVAKDLQRTIEELGYEVTASVASAAAAIQAAEKQRPDLVLLDIHIKGPRDGVEAAQDLRTMFEVPIVFLTAFADPPTIDRARAIEPYGYLIKPVKPDELRAAVEIALHKHEMEFRLRKSERRLRAILDSAGEGIVVAGENGKFVIFNATAERILGRGATDSSPRDWAETYGVFAEDKVTKVPAEDLPLVRAIRGEACDRVELFIRNPRTPEGALVSFTGRALRNEYGELDGGVVTFSDVTELKAARERLAEMASTDGLTGMPNHRAFKARLTQLLAEGDRGRKFALVMCDVDHFKALNDRHGHQMGNEVLVAVADALQGSIRKTDFVARYGGEEFAVLYPDVNEERAATLAEKLRAAISDIIPSVAVTASFGVCEYVTDFKEDGSALIRAADEALYRAKHMGRNRVVRFHASGSSKQ